MSLIPFKYGGQQVRVIDREGEPWFALVDVRDALQLHNSNAVVTRIRNDDGVAIHYPITDSLGRTQDAVWISEAGLYKLAFQSQVEQAEAFTRTTKTGKTYTHVVAVQTDTGHWAVMNWCGRPDLANKAAEQQRRYMAQGWRRVAAIEIIPVSVEGGEPDER